MKISFLFLLLMLTISSSKKDSLAEFPNTDRPTDSFNWCPYDKIEFWGVSKARSDGTVATSQLYTLDLNTKRNKVLRDKIVSRSKTCNIIE